MPRIALFILVGLLAFGIGGWLSGTFSGPAAEQPAQIQRGYVLDAPRPLPAFELVDQDGQVFTQDSFKGDWSFIYFGYTYCPDICPMSMAELARMRDELGSFSDGLADQYYLVSVDPRRDSPERLKEYVAYFNPEFKGLTGDKPALDTFTRAAGVVYQVPDAPADADYLVGHSSTITLVNPDGAIHAFFTTPLEAGPIARDFKAIVANWSAQP
jgi:protein SCO1/2